MSVLIEGKNLNKKQIAQVKAAFVHRFTGEHIPQWSLKPMPNGESYKPLFENDSEWINAYAFWFINDGSRLCKNHKFCVSMIMYEVEKNRNK